MKILNINFSDNGGGAAIAVKRFHEILLNHKINSKLLVSEKKFDENNTFNIPKNSEKIKNLVKDSFNRNLIKFLKKKNFRSSSLNIIPSKLVKKINEIKPDIVHLHWIGNDTISIKDISKIKCKIVWTMHDMWPFCGTEHYSSNDKFVNGYKNKNSEDNFFLFDIDKYIWNLKKKNYLNIDKIICTSEWMYNKVIQSKLFCDKKIKIISLPIDQLFWKPVERNWAKNFFNIKKNEKLIIFGADNFIKNKRKGFNLFLEAIKILKKQKKIKYKILTFGETKNLKEFSNLNIENLGYIYDDYSKKLLYSAADVTVVPSTLEAFGLVAQEATHCGSPCVVFKNTGLTSIIKNGKNGYLADYGSSKSLASGIKWCLDNMHNKQYEIHKYTKKKFETNTIIKSYLDFLKS